MQVSHLTSYGLPQAVVANWQRRLGETLLPLQERAVIEHRLLSGESLLICAPTSSGKTFCGEMAATAALFRRRKALFLAPLKSIAEERYRDFAERYGALGIRVVISTSDHAEHDAKLERGDFDLGILIYEKFNQLLIKNIDLLAPIELVVIDEAQMLGDAERGATLELAITKLLLQRPRPQIVALSATLANADELARWLGCRLLRDDHRPVELRHGVVVNGCFRYRTADGRSEGVEILADEICDRPEELLLVNIERVINDGGPVLAFLRSKRACEQLVWELAERNSWPRAEQAIIEIENETPTALSRRLIETLQSSVAFHHADLTYRQRRILEAAYRAGEIKALIATTTLAMGVNLPAQTVFIDSCKYQHGARTGKGMIAPLEWSEYEAMSGRAGRFGQGIVFGRSVLIASSEIEAETLWKMYVTGAPARLESRLSTTDPADSVLDLVSARVAKSIEELLSAVNRTWQASISSGIAADELRSVVTQLVDAKLMFVDGESLIPSPLGQAVSRRGLSFAAARQALEFLRSYDGADPLSWIYLALSLPDIGVLPVYLQFPNDSAARWRPALARYLREHNHPAEPVSRLAADEYVVTEAELLRLKAALLLVDWIGADSTIEIEERFHTRCGAIMQLAEMAGWLLESLAALAEPLNRPLQLAGQLRRLASAARVGFDLPDSLYANMDCDAAERDLVWTLFNAGWVTAGQFAESKRGSLSRLIGAAAAERILARVAEWKKRNRIEDNTEEESMATLRLRGDWRGERVQIVFNEATIAVTPKSYNYLFKLGTARLLRPDGWLSKDEIEPGLNQAKNIYRIKQELKRYATGLEDRIENNKSGHYRLNLRPEQIKIDIEAMKSFSDLELVELTRRLEREKVS